MNSRVFYNKNEHQKNQAFIALLFHQSKIPSGQRPGCGPGLQDQYSVWSHADRVGPNSSPAPETLRAGPEDVSLADWPRGDKWAWRSRLLPLWAEIPFIRKFLGLAISDWRARA